MNYVKTKTVTNQDDEITITVAQRTVEQVIQNSWNVHKEHLGQIVKLNKVNQTVETKAQIILVWAVWTNSIPHGSLSKANVDKTEKLQRTR